MSAGARRDPRLTPARPDLAAAELRGEVDAPRYVEARVEQVIVEVADVRRGPSPAEPVDTQAIRGELVRVYEIAEGWVWGQLVADGYVGYLPAIALAPAGAEATHRVVVPRTFLYPAASMKMPVEMALPLNAQVHATGRSGDFAKIGAEGYVWAGHLAPAESSAADYVGVAETFIGVPYLWGGKTFLGTDCSGLVQTAMTAAGIDCPRDTDMQEAALGRALTENEISGGLRRGDLVFWKGHVGIMRDSELLLHANGHHMQVASEPFAGARERIRVNSFGEVTSVRRLPSLA